MLKFYLLQNFLDAIGDVGGCYFLQMILLVLDVDVKIFNSDVECLATGGEVNVGTGVLFSSKM